MREGWDFSAPSSTYPAGVLYTADPYRAVQFVEHAAPAAFEALAELREKTPGELAAAVEAMSSERREDELFVLMDHTQIDALLDYYGAPYFPEAIGYAARRLWLLGYCAGAKKALDAPAAPDLW